ncbi:single-stranded DNA-binding protein [Flammeovirgaceae bacterium SG7u.111]|nr:single-stranded DNA-binding protein [Flammeovirgaceae bacterium SG7u.132]WPO34635.1 single-stranded DNA-binding protein [Flammeovirgaceae bacterium SG7u.111]
MLNEVQLLGRVGQAPELKKLDGGSTVATFSIATTEKWKDEKGELKEATEWHNAEAWNGIADTVSKYVEKGDMILIKGKLKTEKWEKDGQKHSSTKVRVTNLHLLPKGKGGMSDQDKQDVQQSKELLEYLGSLPEAEKTAFKEKFINFKKFISEENLNKDTAGFLGF